MNDHICSLTNLEMINFDMGYNHNEIDIDNRFDDLSDFWIKKIEPEIEIEYKHEYKHDRDDKNCIHIGMDSFMEGLKDSPSSPCNASSFFISNSPVAVAMGKAESTPSASSANINISTNGSNICQSKFQSQLQEDVDMNSFDILTITDSSRGSNKSYSPISKSNNSHSIDQVENHQEKMKLFVCNYEECKKSFNHKWILDRHLLTHKSTKMFKCEYERCVKSYKSKENLTLHIKNIHLNQKPYSCKYCPSLFSHRNGKLIFYIFLFI